MYEMIFELVVFSSNRGRTAEGPCGEYTVEHGVGMTVVLGSPLALRRMRRHLVVPVDGVAVAVESTVLHAYPGWNAEGAADVGLALVKVRTSSEGLPHACQGFCSRGSTRSRQHIGGSSVKHVRTGSEQRREWRHSGRSWWTGLRSHPLCGMVA